MTTLEDLRVELEAIKVRNEQYADMAKKLDKMESTIDCIKRDVAGLQADISRWKGALGVAGFILTAMGGVVTTMIDKMFFKG